MRIIGGHSVQAQQMVDGWARDPDVEGWLVPIDPLPPKLFRPLLRIRFIRTAVTALCYWPLLARDLRRADLVHVFSAAYTSFLIAAVPAIVVAKMFNRPVILNYHSGEASDHLRRSRFARFVLRHWVDAIVVPSAFLQGIFGDFGLNATVVPNTIDTARFAYRPRDPIRPRLLSTRNFEPHYNVACTLRAFDRLQARHPNACLTLVGGGSEEAALRRLADSLRLRQVTFAGRVDPAEIHRYYADADLYVQTPMVDNMPLSLLEAFASGLPVVSTRAGGVPVMLSDGVHGLLVPPDDDHAVAARLMELLDSPQRARELAANARAMCRAFEWPVVGPQWAALYRSLRSVNASPIGDARESLRRSESV
jgi:glycosyltransferase involved in cell wall biosynthesis